MRWVSQGQLVGELMGSGVGDLKGIQVLETGRKHSGVQVPLGPTVFPFSLQF